MGNYRGLDDTGYRGNATNSPYSTPKLLFILLLGIVMGFIIAVAWTFSSTTETIGKSNPLTNTTESADYEVDEVHAIESKVLANRLFDEVRVLCWVMTTKDRIEQANNTIYWNKRCNKVLYISNGKVGNLTNTVILPTEKDRDKPWGKTKEALAYLAKHHINDADWFLRADDNSFMVMENLRYMLYPYPSNSPLYFHSNFMIKPEDEGKVDNWRGSNFVLSAEGLRKVAETGLNDPERCTADNQASIYESLTVCMYLSAIKLIPSSDDYGHERFLAFITDIQPFPVHKDLNDHVWYWGFIFHSTLKGITYPSDMAVSFQCVRPSDMIVMDYLIYHLRTYGLATKTAPLPDKITEEQINKFPQFPLHDVGYNIEKI